MDEGLLEGWGRSENFGVRTEPGGKTAGLVYSVSTLGNVAATLATTFHLIPSFGIRAITMTFGVVLAVLAVLLYLARGRLGKGIRTAAAVIGLGACALGAPAPADAEERPHDAWAASYPEGPLWIGERLLYAEMGTHKVVEWKAGQRRDFWHEAGCGPTGPGGSATGPQPCQPPRNAKAVQSWDDPWPTQHAEAAAAVNTREPAPAIALRHIVRLLTLTRRPHAPVTLKHAR